MRILPVGIAAILCICAARAAADDLTPADRAVPRYEHVIVIVEENKSYEQILNPAAAPNIAGLAAQYGDAAQFFSEVHPSEANYVAILGGDTFGIHDDDAYYCHAGSQDPFCPGAAAPGYADHTVRAPHLGQQLDAVGLTWKGYYEDLPEAGSPAVIAGDRAYPDPLGRKSAFYASKHSGFMNFASVQSDPHRAGRIVGFDRLEADLAADRLPNFALIVPNQCNEMHGLNADNLPPGCSSLDQAGLIRRGDTEVGALVKRIQTTPAWRGRGNFAIVVTFDEGAGRVRAGCCRVTPGAASNFGGGHIPTIVITNHGPRGMKDETPYNHYSLLRTLEDAFGISKHLGLAAATDQGVVPMVKLFALAR
ncbi:MAG TPA: alkaline phosphatase family protein [Caulobacteraceae bacterium]|nr:alkaline phosphatase family protein [Caulobacteraceae bacterium]